MESIIIVTAQLITSIQCLWWAWSGDWQHRMLKAVVEFWILGFGFYPCQIQNKIESRYKQIDHWLKGDSVSWSGWRLLGEIVWSASCVSLSCLYTRVNSNVRSVRLGFGFIFQWVGARNRKNWCTRSNPHRGFHEIKISCVSNLHWLSVLQAWKDATGVRGRYKT